MCNHISVGWLMKEDHKHHSDIVDEDLYEEFDDEELYELVEEARKKAVKKSKQNEQDGKSKRPFPKWSFWLIAIAMIFNIVALLPQTFSVPALDFLKTSAKLSVHDDIQTYKQAVVVIETDDSRGTGFSISDDGVIVTNHHVVEDHHTVTVAFPNDGLFAAEVMETYTDIDLAVLKVKSDEPLPTLELATHSTVSEHEKVYFIGNPLRFQGIANEGTIIDDIHLNDWEKEVRMIKAPIYRGNSGSPIIDGSGQVIGVVFATLHHSQHGKVGLFIPIDYLYEKNDAYMR